MAVFYLLFVFLFRFQTIHVVKCCHVTHVSSFSTVSVLSYDPIRVRALCVEEPQLRCISSAYIMSKRGRHFIYYLTIICLLSFWLKCVIVFRN